MKYPVPEIIVATAIVLTMVVGVEIGFYRGSRDTKERCKRQIEAYFVVNFSTQPVTYLQDAICGKAE